MGRLRTKSLTTKFTGDEWAAVARAAVGQPVAAWARAILLSAASRLSADQVLLAEILAVRTLVLHIQLAVYHGDPLTPESLRQLMARVDEDKIQHARERLAGAATRRLR
jgi:hypothetical protein